MMKVKKVRTLSFFQSSALTLLKQSILFILLWLIFRDVLSTGELIAMQFISVAIFAPQQELGNIIIAYREAVASLNNFAKLSDQASPNKADLLNEAGRLLDNNIAPVQVQVNKPFIVGLEKYVTDFHCRKILC